MTLANVEIHFHLEQMLWAMWQEKSAVYLISSQFTDGFHITKGTIHPIPPVSTSTHPYHYDPKQTRE